MNTKAVSEIWIYIYWYIVYTSHELTYILSQATFVWRQSLLLFVCYSNCSLAGKSRQAKHKTKDKSETENYLKMLPATKGTGASMVTSKKEKTTNKFWKWKMLMLISFLWNSITCIEVNRMVLTTTTTRITRWQSCWEMIELNWNVTYIWPNSFTIFVNIFIIDYSDLSK